MQVLTVLIVCVTFIGILVLASLCWKWWIQNGLDKFLESEANRRSRRNADLHRKLRAQKREIKQLREMLETRDIEIEELEENIQECEQINESISSQVVEEIMKKDGWEVQEGVEVE